MADDAAVERVAIYLHQISNRHMRPEDARRMWDTMPMAAKRQWQEHARAILKLAAAE